jgi:hypothetical protein
MAGHKYRVGQHVTFRPMRVSGVGLQACTIVRQLPAEEGSCLYRIKYTVGNVERVFRESELLPRIAAA